MREAKYHANAKHCRIDLSPRVREERHHADERGFSAQFFYDNFPVYQNVIPVNAAVAPAGPDVVVGPAGGGGGGPGGGQAVGAHNPAAAQPVNPEEEELPLYPQFAVQHLDEDEADNIWVADGHAIEVGVAEVHAADDD